MRAKRSQPQAGQSYRTLLFFIIIVGFLVLGSLAIKTVMIIQESTLSNDRLFTVAVLAKDNIQILSVDTKEKTITQLTLNGTLDNKKLGSELGLLIDGFVKVDKKFLENKSANEYFYDFVFGKYTESSLTVYDFLRLALLTGNIPQSKIYKDSFSDTKELENIDKFSLNRFRDKQIDEEHITISIINATSVSGLGKRLERVLTNGGGNVVSVSSTSTGLKRSIVKVTDENSYTFDKLQSFLSFPVEKQVEQGISDITILLGEDSKDTNKF